MATDFSPNSMGRVVQVIGPVVVLVFDATEPPEIYTTNWFRKDAAGKFVWPGYGENMRVLEWMLGRIAGTAKGAENAFGISPNYEDINWSGLSFSQEQFQSVISMDKAAWAQELKLHEELFSQLAYHLPVEMPATKAKIEQRLGL